jgi:chemotaxis protein histidine kinase CheA
LDEREFESKLKDEFLVEAEELLAFVDDGFVRLEQAPGDHQIVDHIFRAVHTIKGSAGIAGFGALSALAHELETCLSGVRSRHIAIDAGTISTLLAGTDALKSLVAALKNDHAATQSHAAVVVRLSACAARAAPPPAARPSQTPRAAPDRATAAPARPTAAPAPDATPPAAPARQRVLIVEDEPALLEVLVEALGELDTPVDVVPACNGKDGWNAWNERGPFNLIITDQKMPGWHGTELVKRIKEHDPDVPVVVVSGQTSRDEAVQFLRLGVYDFLDKPFRAEALLLTVRNALRAHAQQTAMRQLSRLLMRSYLGFRRLNSELMRASVPVDEAILEQFSTALRGIGLLVREQLDLDQAEARTPPRIDEKDAS